MTYTEQLQDERWIKRRQEIFERDWGICQHCMTSRDIQVHHKAYIKDRMAWDYADYYLITLCRECHAEEHRKKFIPILEQGYPIVEGFDKISKSLEAIGGLMRKFNG